MKKETNKREISSHTIDGKKKPDLRVCNRSEYVTQLPFASYFTKIISLKHVNS